MTADPIVIVDAVRTPVGSFLGELKSVNSPTLGATVIEGLLKRQSIDPKLINEVFMGCVLPAGIGQAPARQAALNGGLPLTTGCTTINKVCGSGMKAVMLGHDLLQANSVECIIAGGMESMSNAPYLLDKARSGYRLGHGTIKDHMFVDGLEDAYDKGRLMGYFAEDCVKHYHVTRAAQDAFALESFQRARAAIKNNNFAQEIIPVTIETRESKLTISEDEGPNKVNIENISKLRPAFGTDGTITAANASSIADGAAALLLMRLSTAKKLGLQPLAKIVAHTTHSQEPHWFTTAPIAAIQKLFVKAGWKPDQVDLYEINEAFAVVTMVAMQVLNLPPEKVNVHGGACALGHPIGASGARIIVTLLHALRQRQLQRGIAALCIGGGEATAIAVEMI